MVYPPSKVLYPPAINGTFYKTATGASLPLRRWLPKSGPKAILVAVHGFNDYSKFFSIPGQFFSDHDIACFAYDQRGFGSAPKRGRWAGVSAYVDDLHDFLTLIKQQYPGLPVYLLGESMGGAIVITALKGTYNDYIDGAILVAPALWARQTMPWYQSGLLWTLAHTVPWLALSGSSVKVQASDNINMLRELGRDPQIIKKTRVETIYGLADLMDEAYSSADLLKQRTLVLYGEKDEIIPKQPTYEFLNRFMSSPGKEKTVAIYPEGYHMLLRDLKASVPWSDILSWIGKSPALPSGADQRAKEILKKAL